jgi:hypothetical protein
MDKDTKKVVKAACERGWTLLGGNKHPILQHILSGRKVAVPSSPSCPHSSKNTQKDIERVEREYAAGKDFCSPDQCLCRVLGEDPSNCAMGVPRSAT